MSKTCLTYAFTVNTHGSDKLPVFVIGCWKKPRAFDNCTAAQLSFKCYRNNTKTWMTTVLYQEWITDLDCNMAAQHCNILLLQDNISGHVTPEGLHTVCVENLKANLTVHVQPMIKVSSNASRPTIMQSSSNVQSIAINYMSPPLPSTKPTNSKPCSLLRLHGKRWTL